MAYNNDRTERAKLHRQWIDEQDRPCRKCGAHGVREIHRKTPGYLGGKYIPVNCEVLCYGCHRLGHPNSKFMVGDKVVINGRSPVYLGLGRRSPRTIIAIEYDPVKQCNFYTLGSNGRGSSLDGQPLEGMQFYKFRSYQLQRYIPRKYGKRRYRMRPDDSRLTGRIDQEKTAGSILTH